MGIPTIVTAIISSVVSSAISMIFTSMMAKGAEPKDVGAKIAKSGTIAPRSPIYGKCIIPATKVWSNVNNNNASQLVSVFAAGIGEIEAIHKVYIDEKQCIHEGNYKSDPNGGVNQLILNGTGDFSNQNVKVQLRTGLEHETALGLAISNGDGEWTTDHRGDRVVQCAILATRNIKDENARIMAAQYNVTMQVSGLKLFDPRIHSEPADKTQRIFSRNPALAIADYLTDTYYGMSIPWSYIDMKSLIISANYCDQMGFYIDGQIPSDESFATNLANMLACFGGIAVSENGYILIKPETMGMPVAHFTEDNIIGGNINVTSTSTSNYYNSVDVRFKAINQLEKGDTYTLPADVMTDPTILKDGYIKSKTIDLPFVLDGKDGIVSGAVKYIANRERKKAYWQKEAVFKFDMDLIELHIYDIVEVSNEHYGWNKKQFRVMAIDRTIINDDEFNIGEVTLREYDRSIYDNNEDGIIGKPTKPVQPITPPVAIEFNLLTYITDGYGLLTWQNTTKLPSLISQIEYKLESDESYTRLGETKETEWKVSHLREGNYIFRVRNYHNVRGVTDWEYSNVIKISPSVVFPEVSGINTDVKTSDFIIKWDNMLPKPVGNPLSGVDSGGSDNTVNTFFSHYEIEVYHFESGEWKWKRTASSTVNSYTYLFADNVKDGINRKCKFIVRIIAKDGTRSTTQTAGCKIEATNPQMNAPSGLDIKSKVGMIFCSWEQPAAKEPDYVGTRIYISDNSGFVPSGDNMVFDGTGSYTYYWQRPDPYDDKVVYSKYVKVGHYDKFGSDGMILSPEITVTYSSIDHDITPFDPTDLNNKIEQNRQDIENIDKEWEGVLPTFSHELEQIRNPENAPEINGQKIDTLLNVVTSKDKTRTAGYGIVAKNTDTEKKSQFIIAADELIIAGGKGHTDNDNTSMVYYDTIKDKFFINNATIKELTASNIKAGSITSNEIAAEAITANNIAANAITTNMIQAGAINAAKLSANCIETNHITAGAITAAKIQAGAITGDKISATTLIKIGTRGGLMSYISGIESNKAFASGCEVNDQYELVNPKFSIDHNGDFESKAQGKIHGILTVGNETAGNFFKFYGNVNSGSDRDVMLMHNGGMIRFAMRHNGRTIWNGTTGNTMLDINTESNELAFNNASGKRFLTINNDGASFNGDVFVENLKGDIIDMVVKQQPYYRNYVVEDARTPIEIFRLNILESAPFTRILLINKLSVYIDTATIDVKLYWQSDWNSNFNVLKDIETGEFNNFMGTITIPENVKGAVVIRCKSFFDYQDRATYLTNNDYPVQINIFKISNVIS